MTSSAPAMTSATTAPTPLWRVVCALGITQIISWGSLHYSIAVLAQPMAASLELSVSAVLAAFSAALFVSGLVSPMAGRLIDRHGGRRIMAVGSLIAAGSLLVIAFASHPIVLFAGWLLAGAAMAATLYDAAFATLNEVSGTRHRQALTALTLFGGLASTAFWPLTYAVNEASGWREVLVLYAGLHLFGCLPLHLALLPRRRSATTMSNANVLTTQPVSADVRRAVWWLATSFAFGAVIFSALSVHLLSTLHAQGLTPAQAVAVAVIVGPMQLAGRIIEFIGAPRLRAVSVGTISMLVMLVALALLLFTTGAGWVALAFAALYGASNGVMTIVRGTVPAELFGRQDYGALLGRLAGPAFIGKAIAPVAYAAMAGVAGHDAAVTALCGLGVLALLSYSIAVHTGLRN
jgi:predicted MFS family arabinose efflux permease